MPTTSSTITESGSSILYRDHTDFEPLTRFCALNKAYALQYNVIYRKRLAQISPMLRYQVYRAWGVEAKILDRIIDAENADSDASTECVLIGTLFKDMSLRGSILDEFRESNGLSAGVQSMHNNLSSTTDSLVLEDGSGRVSLGIGATLVVGEIVTGVTVAVRGRVSSEEGSLGIFQVSAVLCCRPTSNLAPSRHLSPPLPVNLTSPKSRYLCLVSGLRLGSDSYGEGQGDGPSSNAVRLLFSFLAGRIGSGGRDEDLARRVVRVIIAGDSIAEGKDHNKDLHRGKQPPSSSASGGSSSSSSAVRGFDLLLAQLLESCPVDLMPGASDPASIFLPQQPLHSCLFPHSSRFSSLHRTTNPMSCRIDGRLLVMGHSGQPVSDISRQVAVTEGAADSSLRILRSTLEWGHLCPTAPDTLPCHPVQADQPDPFVLDQRPDLLFAGNMPSFGSELVQVLPASASEEGIRMEADGAMEVEAAEGGEGGGEGSRGGRVRLLCVPSFATTGQVVLVDISSPDLPCHVLQFR